MNRKLLLALSCLAVIGAGCRKQVPLEQQPFRIGFFPNLTHAQALIGEEDGTFSSKLSPTRVEFKKFNAGPAAMEALLAGELDATYVGPGPAINLYVRTRGALKVIAGAAAGGAVLVVHTAKGPEDLRGKKVASPQLGNSQDIALRHWLTRNGLKPSSGGRGDVTVVPIANSDILNLFRRGDLEAAWVPEPWGARLIAEAGGHILVDERDLWQDGRFPMTLLVASTRALEQRPEQVKQLLAAHVELTRRAVADPGAFHSAATSAFKQITGQQIPEAVLSDAFSRITFTVDPMERQLAVAAQHASELGFIPNAQVEGLVDRRLLNEVAPPPSARRPPRDRR